MKTIPYIFLLCSACSNSFQSGEYLATYGELSYSVTSPGDILSSECALEYQRINPSKRIRVDAPDILEIESANDALFDLSSTDCSFFSHQITSVDERNIIVCENWVAQDIMVTSEGQEQVLQVEFHTTVELKDQGSEASGEIHHYVNHTLDEGEEELLRTQMNPDCGVTIQVDMELVD